MSPHLSRMDRRDEGNPSDRLGRIAAAMLEAAERHPESRDGDRAIVMLDGPEGRGMLAHGGYEKDEGADAFVNLLGHVDALAQANGMQLDFIPRAGPAGQG